METFDIVKYWEDIATRLKELAHSKQHPTFYRTLTVTGFEELMMNLRYAKFPALVLLYDSSGIIAGPNADQLNDKPNVTIFLLNKVSINDFDNHQKSTKDLKAIHRKILSKMRRDRRAKPDLYSFEVQGNYEPIGPYADNIYGLMYNFNYIHSIPNNDYNEDDWLPVNP